ncbi:MAG: sulfate ABC transporter permease subunit [Chloroflexi bacterium]|nr:sulfate ABC transporter permease subunit [Chloroflexota bacterium]
MTAASSATATGARPVDGNARRGRAVRLTVRGIVLLYLALLLLLPVAMVFIRAFESGIGPVVQAIGRPAFQSAFWLTVQITVITVPICTVMGVVTALAIARRRFPGRSVLNALEDQPFALSPVVIGLSLFLVYSTNSPIRGFLADHGITIIFAVPGMILATIFVCLRFVIREVVPVLREIGTDQEEAAYTLGAGPVRTFWRVTLPAIRWGIVYGVILTTARSLGEFGAVAIVSGKISGKTITLTTHVQERYEAFDIVGAYTASIVLAGMALLVLVGMQLYQSGRLHRGSSDNTPPSVMLEPAATAGTRTEGGI